MGDDENAEARDDHPEGAADSGEPCPAVYDRRARLYRSARAGDRRAQRELFEDLNELLWRMARRAGLDREGAADAVQTAWLRLWLPKNELENPRALTKWLMVTVKREAWRMAGGARRELTTDPIEFPRLAGRLGDPAGDTEREFEREAVRRAFLAQPERCRKILAYVAAMDRPDYGDIAESLGMKRGSIGPTRGRCLNRLRKALLDDPDWGRNGPDD
ncbi:RNA polymerase sigma factor [Glycomyces salinus]|uniref:RNA polymerase sigma factor n=1 Tax=Glycomyces salinus TaxID=980294 RepID=UPI0018EB1A81|nr:sigma-70 family RNA polymerase sigma factor [Glycomyces salinus]